MKFLAILILALPIQAFSQEFVESTTYVTQGVDRQIVEDYNMRGNYDDPLFGYVVLAADTSESVLSFTISYPDLYEGTYIKELINPGLKNVKKILLVQHEYAACCYDIEAFYYIVTKKDELIELDLIDYSMCDWPATIPEYRFPSQEYGLENQILSADIFHNYEGTIDSAKVNSVLNWDGKKIKP